MKRKASVISEQFRAFSLAEVLITLLVIGIIALVVLPSISNDIQNIIFRERNKNVLFKLSQATDNMKVLGFLDTKYASTSAFVDELSKHLKIVKRCNNDNLNDCFASGHFSNAHGQLHYVQSLKTSSDVGLSSWGSENEAFIMADGTSVIITYNVNNCKPIKEFDQITYSDNQTSSTLNCVSLIFDLNSKAGPNSTNKDIRTLNNPVGDYKVGNTYFSSQFSTADSITFNKCEQMKSQYDLTYCCPESYCNNQETWAVMKKNCIELGRSLPSASDVNAIAEQLYGQSVSTSHGIFTNSLTIKDKDLWDFITNGATSVRIYTDKEYTDKDAYNRYFLETQTIYTANNRRAGTKYFCVSK